MTKFAKHKPGPKRPRKDVGATSIGSVIGPFSSRGALSEDGGSADQRLVIGVDVGTSATKAVLLSSFGEVLAAASAGGKNLHTERGTVECDPGEWWDEVSAAVGSVAAGHHDDVVALAFTGQMLGIVPVSGDGEVVRPAILWADARGEEQARNLIRRFLGPVALRLLGGGVPTAKDVVPKLLWLAEHEPDHHRRTVTYLDVVGYLILRATGDKVMEYSAASATGLLDQRRRRWSTLLARAASVDPAKLAELVGATDVAGSLSAEAARSLGIRPGTPVVAAGGDAISAIVGAGVRPMIQVGTSGWISMVTDRRDWLPPTGVAYLCWVDPERYLKIAVSEAVAPCLTWITRLLYGRADQAGIELLEQEIERAEHGTAGLMFAPWLIGERSPFNNPAVRGGLFNLGLEHGPPELARAVMEGIALNFRWILEHIGPEHGEPIRIGGGVAASDVFVQVLADVIGRTIERVGSPQHSTAAGAALTAFVALGHFRDIASAGECVAVDARFEPGAAFRNSDFAGGAFRRLPKLLDSFHAELSRGQEHGGARARHRRTSAT